MIEQAPGYPFVEISFRYGKIIREGDLFGRGELFMCVKIKSTFSNTKYLLKSNI